MYRLLPVRFLPDTPRNELTAWIRVIFENITVALLLKIDLRLSWEPKFHYWVEF
jgi:hypothetical protein